MAIYSGFSHYKCWFSIVVCMFTRGYPYFRTLQFFRINPWLNVSFPSRSINIMFRESFLSCSPGPRPFTCMRTCKTGPYNLSPGTEKCLMPLKNGRYEESEAAVLELLTLKDRQIDILSSNFSFFQRWWECKWMDWRDFFTRLWQASFGKLVTTLKKTLGHFQSHGLGQLHIYSASEGSWRIRRSPPLGGLFMSLVVP